MEQTITCISCPVGCRMTVQVEEGAFVSVAGNTCKRGETYARQECVAPERMVTAVIPVEGSAMPLSVKTRTPIPKAKIQDCMAALAKVRLTAPVAMGAVVLADVCGTGVDVIATKSVE
ncbi:MAG: DUF1667 domain-containing protein [Christensenellaceae bacterium]|nr:DUF1667 domain-containing protein [Christensenellaceae bacterium]